MKPKTNTTLRILACMAFMLVTSGAIAQRDGGIAPQAISKDVQRFAMRKMIFVPARIVTAPYQLSSKPVQLIGKRTVANTDFQKVQMTGIPSHVISKGVARMQYERTNPK
jgi:hypothetical protein